MTKWSELLSQESLHQAKRLVRLVDEEKSKGSHIFPPRNDIFKALTLTPPDQVSVVIIGQDPYFHEGRANGLAFSVNQGVPLPPSLRNIFKELHNDIGCPVPQSGDLTPWAKQGVLLLNTSLTVEEGKPNSHSKWGWQSFVLEVCKVCVELPQPVVFLLWGGYARAFLAGLQISDSNNKCAIFSSHPSPLGATKGNEAVPAFIGSWPFSKANAFLTRMGATPINWRIS